MMDDTIVNASVCLSYKQRELMQMEAKNERYPLIYDTDYFVIWNLAAGRLWKGDVEGARTRSFDTREGGDSSG